MHGMEITSTSGAMLRGRYDVARGFGLPRRELDSLLLRHAVSRGVSLRDDTRVMGLARDGTSVRGVLVRRRGRDEVVGARVVVGADGLRSTVARAFGGASRVGERRLALVAQVADVAGLHGVGEIFVGPRGYAGIAPLPGGAANVAVVLRAAMTPRGRSREQLFWDAIAGFPSVDDRVRGRPVLRGVLATGPFGWRSRNTVLDGALLVGDAAQFFDPITGDGVAAALTGGALAADAIAEALARWHRPTRQSMAAYESARRRRFGARWLAQRALGLAVERPRLFDAGVRYLAQYRSAGDRIVRFAGGTTARRYRMGRPCASELG